MDLFLVRHAIAQDPSEAQPDAERALTARGQRRFRESVRGLRRLEAPLGGVVHSPLVRAAQTAALLAPWLEGPVVASELLTASPGEPLLALLAETGASRLAVVGHEPWLGELASLLLTGDLRHGGNFPFRKGGVLWLSGELQPGQMALGGALAPRVLRRVTRA